MNSIQTIENATLVTITNLDDPKNSTMEILDGKDNILMTKKLWKLEIEVGGIYLNMEDATKTAYNQCLYRIKKIKGCKTTLTKTQVISNYKCRIEKETTTVTLPAGVTVAQ